LRVKRACFKANQQEQNRYSADADWNVLDGDAYGCNLVNTICITVIILLILLLLFNCPCVAVMRSYVKLLSPLVKQCNVSM